MTVETEIPPMPVSPPDVHLRSKKRTPSRTLKGDLRLLKERATTVATDWKNRQEKSEKKQEEVRSEAKKILAPVQGKIEDEKELASEVLEPVKKVFEAGRELLDPKNGRSKPYVTSFLISSIACWAIGPQIFTALYGLVRFGVVAEDWGILNGPGRWFRDTVGMAYETDQVGTLVWSAVMGLLPMVIMFARNIAAGHLADASYQGRAGRFVIKSMTRLSYLVPVAYLTGVAYPDTVQFLFGAPWVLEWWNFWVAGLFCSAFYCTLWVFDRAEKRLPLGGTHVVLMMPLASIVTGICLYAPDAAW